MGSVSLSDFIPFLSRLVRLEIQYQDLGGQEYRTLYRWAEGQGYISQSKLQAYRYKVHKDKRPARIREYDANEVAAILEQLPLDRPTKWRPSAAIALCGLQGARANAVLHLRWDDIDFEARTIRWRSEPDQVGKDDEKHPLRQRSRAVLEAIRPYTDGKGWVFPPGSSLNKRGPYTIQSLIVALHKAEVRARVAKIENRASHSLRRMLFNDVLGITGDIGAAMAAIRDTSLQVASKYVRGRDERVRNAFALLDNSIVPKLFPNPERSERAEGVTDAA